MNRLRTLAPLFALVATCATAQTATELTAGENPTPAPGSREIRIIIPPPEPVATSTPPGAPPDFITIAPAVQTREAIRIKKNALRLARTPLPTPVLRCRTPAPGITCCEYVSKDWRGTDVPTAIGCFPSK